MRSLDDIIVGNAHWEHIQRANRERIRRIEESESKLLPRLRSLWGDGPSDERLLMWYRASDAVTRSLFQ